MPNESVGRRFGKVIGLLAVLALHQLCQRPNFRRRESQWHARINASCGYTLLGGLEWHHLLFDMRFIPHSRWVCIEVGRCWNLVVNIIKPA